jgi:hypothetical protein
VKPTKDDYKLVMTYLKVYREDDPDLNYTDLREYNKEHDINDMFYKSHILHKLGIAVENYEMYDPMKDLDNDDDHAIVVINYMNKKLVTYFLKDLPGGLYATYYTIIKSVWCEELKHKIMKLVIEKV